MSAPAGTPRPIIEKLNAELRRAISSEDIQKRLVAEGTEPEASTPEEYAANLEREEAKWADLIKKLGLKFD
jgi:tripartite-type tricarboxylate transporter receptor subunit TctC